MMKSQEVTRKFNEVKFVTMDAGYKTPWIAKNTIEDGRVPVLPYTKIHRAAGQIQALGIYL